MVCSLASEPIPGDIRVQWVKEAFPKANVVWLNDSFAPQEPKDENDNAFWDYWRNAVIRLTQNKKFDVVFSSENYGFRLAEELSAYHHLVDEERIIVPMSGTKVRSNPYKNWDYIPDHVKPYFVKRVLITGPESCGKSTMSELLAKVFCTTWSPEWARDHWDEIGGWEMGAAGLNKIADGQHQYQLEAIKKANKITFSDTSAIETFIYSRIMLGESTPSIVDHLNDQRNRFDLVILLTPKVRYVQDGLRKHGDQRWEIYEQFKQVIESLDLPHVIIDSDDYAQRTLTAIDYCRKLMDENTYFESLLDWIGRPR